MSALGIAMDRRVKTNKSTRERIARESMNARLRREVAAMKAKPSLFSRLRMWWGK